jgi:hypothetical protein
MLSSYLFILSMEELSKMLLRAQTEGHLKEITLTNGASQVMVACTQMI